jgi:hypothetical protein
MTQDFLYDIGLTTLNKRDAVGELAEPSSFPRSWGT